MSDDRPVELSTLTSQVSAEPKGDKPQITSSPVTISGKEDHKATEKEKEEEATQGSLDKEEDSEDAQRPTATRFVPGKDGEQGQGHGQGLDQGQGQGQGQGREVNLPVPAGGETSFGRNNGVWKPARKEVESEAGETKELGGVGV